MQLAVGMIFDHIGVRKALIPSVLCVAGGSLMCEYAGSLEVFTAGRLLQGFGSAFAFVGAMFLAKIWFPLRRLALLAGCTTAFGMIGAIGGNAGIAKVIQELGWRFTWAAAGYFGIALAVTLYFFVPKLPSWEVERRVKEKAEHGVGIFIHRLRVVFLNWQIWVVGFVSCSLFLPTAVFGALWGDDYIKAMTGCSMNEASMAVSMLFVGWLVGGPVAGHISDYFHSRKWPIFVSSILTTLFLLLILLPTIKTLWVLYVLIFLAGVASSIQVVCFVVGIEVAPHHAGGTAIAGINLITMLLGGAFQPISGWILDWKAGGSGPDYTVTDYRAALLILPAMTFLSIWVCLLLKESYIEEVDEEIEELAEDEFLV